MAQNFIESAREQGSLLPPDVRDWLPEDHLAWFVIDAVADMDLSEFYDACRADGHGRAAYEPQTMVALLLYAYATKQRSRGRSSATAARTSPTGDHRQPRLRSRHDRPLRLPPRAGARGAVRRGAGALRQGGTGEARGGAIDGTRLAGNASPEANREFAEIAREILAEA